MWGLGSGHTLPLCLPPTPNLAHLICPAAVSPQPSWRHPVARLDSPRTRRMPSGVTRTRWARAASAAPLSAVHAQSAPPPLSVATLSLGCFRRALLTQQSRAFPDRASAGPGRGSATPANSPARLHPKTRATGRLVGSPAGNGFLLYCDQKTPGQCLNLLSVAAINT